MTVDQILAARRAQAEKKRDQRVEALYQRHPEIKEVRTQRLLLNRERIQSLLTSPTPSPAWEAKRKELEEREAQLLQELGLKKDFFEPDYFCKKCKDTGFVHGQSCSCRRQLLVQERYQTSSIGSRLEEENFGTFDLSLFRKDRQAGETYSPYENARMIKEYLEENYVPNFRPQPPTPSPSLYFFGPTGTGKTFFLNSLVKAILDAGFVVYYQTAPDLLRFLADYAVTFPNQRREEDMERFQLTRSADFLVVDDLGSEAGTVRTVAELFSLLNDRILQGRPTAISSNYQLEELSDVYGARISSRIGSFDLYQLKGRDLRRG